jgi:hypothetical protein
MCRVRAWAAGLVVLCAVHPARAQPNEPSAAHASAVARFEEGTRLESQGDCKDAIAAFEASLALEPGVGARLDLADCEERLGLIEAAWRDYRLAEWLAAQRKDGRAKVARERTLVLKEKLELFVLPRIEGLSLRLDGTAVDPQLFADGWLAVSPDAHRIEASAPGHEPLVLSVPPGAPGQSITVPPLAIARVAAAPPPPLVSPQGNGSTQRTLGLALSALGLVGIAIGSIAGVRAIQERRDAGSACGAGYPRCSLANEDAVRSANDGAETFATISTTAFVAGGVALASGALLYFSAPRSGVRVTPAVGAGTAGASVGASW